MLPTQGGILLQGGTPLVPAAQRPSRTYRADFASEMCIRDRPTDADAPRLVIMPRLLLVFVSEAL